MGKQLTIEFIKEEFLKRKGYILLETEYINNKTKMKYICPYHPNENNSISWNSFQSGSGCKYCYYRKLTIEFVRAEFLKRGYILLEDEYINSNIPMRYKCLKHPDEELKIRYKYFSKGNGCKFCSGSYKTHEEYVKKLKLKNSNITVIGEYKGAHERIEVKCNIDGHIWSPIASSLTCANNMKCPVCAGKTVLKGTNDIATTHPYFIEWLENKEDGYLHTYGSAKKAKNKCPECGHLFQTIICQMCRNGLRCPRCGDGISFGEKYMMSLLSHIGIDFKTQIVFKKWSNGKRYDFYIPSINCIIETHGIQHYADGLWSNRGKTSEEEYVNDLYKKQLALKNGIIEYIEIDARNSNYDYIKNSILNSRISEIFDLSIVNWDIIAKQSMKSIVKVVCDYWNCGMNAREISENIGLCDSTIRKYLNQGSSINLCDYDPKGGNMRRKPRLSVK